uniref:restriction endonuclease subunit S n=1 Tax=[Lactobacillus] rogosae TaxID=706562 RepID=UPI003FF0E91C
MNAQDLKNSILQLAVQGKLVEQRAEEGTARELLEHIKREKEQLIKDKKIKKSKPLPEITEDEIPFEIPESWVWGRFGEFGNYKKGPFGSALTKAMFVPKGEDTVKVYEQKNAIQKEASLGNYYITRDYFESKMKGFELFSGDIIVSCAGTIGETYIMPEGIEQGIINQALMRMKLMPSVYVEYFLIYFDVILKQTARKSSKGSAIKNIPPFDELKRYLVPLPPLEEQHRIVAKIEELLPYIEQYDKAYTKLEAFNKKFPEDMKRSILQMAMQGKLVEQRSEEGTADELYMQIADEKTQLIKDGKIKKEKPLPEITDDEIPFEIPGNWKWVRWGELSFSIQYGYNAPALSEGYYRMVRISDIQDNKILWETVPYCKIEDKEAGSYLLEKDDILFARTGGTVGKSFLVKDVPYEAVYAGYLIRTRYNSERLVPEYLKFFMESQLYWQQLRNGTIATAQPNCNGQTLAKMMIPLPPLAEQKRIVTKIEELLPYCDMLR